MRRLLLALVLALAGITARGPRAGRAGAGRAADASPAPPEYDAELTAEPGQWTPAADGVRLPVAARRPADRAGRPQQTYRRGLDDLGHPLAVAGHRERRRRRQRQRRLGADRPGRRGPRSRPRAARRSSAWRASRTPSTPTRAATARRRPRSPTSGCAAAGRSRARPASATRSGPRTSAPGCGSRLTVLVARLPAARASRRADADGPAPGRRAPHGPLPRRDPRQDHHEPEGVPRARPSRPTTTRAAGGAPASSSCRSRSGGAFTLVLSAGQPGAGLLLGVQRDVELPGRPLRDHQPGPLEERLAGLERRPPRAARLPAHGGQPRDRPLARPAATPAARARAGWRR